MDELLIWISLIIAWMFALPALYIAVLGCSWLAETFRDVWRAYCRARHDDWARVPPPNIRCARRRAGSDEGTW